MDDRQLIEDLLSALEYHTEQTRPIEFSKVAIQAAREYLQKPTQQEPVAWEQFYPDIGKPQIEQPKVRTGDCLLVGVCASEGHKIQKAQPKQEPLAWISTGPASMIHWTSDKPAYGDDWVPLYTTPPQREFVGLTKEEIAEFDTWHDNREEEVGWCNPSEIVAYIEAKLKEKNT